MKSKLYKKLELQNGHTLEIHDKSRKIGQDAWLVVMVASIKIDIREKLFESEPVSEFKFNDILDTLGSQVTYEYKNERNFILDHEKDDVFETLVKTFLDNLGKYVTKKQFPPKFVLKIYKDKLQES
jgi:hypothetical protein